MLLIGLKINLIKQLKPKFNVLLRDDKSFPDILISKSHRFPQVVKSRGRRLPDNTYFGPFASAGAVAGCVSAGWFSSDIIVSYRLC